MRTFDAGLEPLVAAVGTWNQIPLGPRKKIDHKPDEPKEQDEKHPKDSAIHAARFCIACDPNQECDAEDEPGDREKDDAAATTGACHAAGSATCVVVLRPNCVGAEQRTRAK
jgi:hypothetical protein